MRVLNNMTNYFIFEINHAYRNLCNKAKVKVNCEALYSVRIGFTSKIIIFQRDKTMGKILGFDKLKAEDIFRRPQTM